MMDYKTAYETLAAQVKRLGELADVQIGDVIAFGDKCDNHQTDLAVLMTVATARRIEEEGVTADPDTLLAQIERLEEDNARLRRNHMEAIETWRKSVEFFKFLEDKKGEETE